MSRRLWCCVWLMACGPTGGDGSDEPAGCGDTPPELGDVTVEDVGTVMIGMNERRAVEVKAVATDADGDLSTFTSFVWADTFVDGELPSLPDYDVEVTLTDDPCGLSQANVGAIVPLGNDVPFSTEIEFGLVVEDAAGNASNDGEPAIVVVTTPEP